MKCYNIFKKLTLKLEYHNYSYPTARNSATQTGFSWPFCSNVIDILYLTDLSLISASTSEINAESVKYKMSITFEQKGQETPVCVAEFLAMGYE